MPYFYFDYSYLVLIPAMIFALVAQAMVSSAFNKYNNVRTGCSMTGADAARLILDRNGLHHVKIEQIAGNLTDHFDPRRFTAQRELRRWELRHTKQVMPFSMQRGTDL